MLIEGDGGVLVDEILHHCLGELVKGVGLLRCKTLCLEEGRDYGPAILGGDTLIVAIIVVGFVLVVVHDVGICRYKYSDRVLGVLEG